MNTSYTKNVFNNGKPKVNLSAYNIFFLTERKRILCGMDEATSRASPFTKEEVLRAVLECKLRRGKRPHRKSHGLISFKNLTNTIGGRWKRLDPESERVVRNQAVIEKRIYMEQKELWRSLSKQGIQPLEFNNNTNQGGEVDDGFPSALGAGGAVTPPFVVVNQSLTPPPVGSGAAQMQDIQVLCKRQQVKKGTEKIVKRTTTSLPSSENSVSSYAGVALVHPQYLFAEGTSVCAEKESATTPASNSDTERGRHQKPTFRSNSPKEPLMMMPEAVSLNFQKTNPSLCTGSSPCSASFFGARKHCPSVAALLAISSADANDNNEHDILSAMKMSICDDSQWFNEMEDTMAMEPIDPQDMDSIFD